MTSPFTVRCMSVTSSGRSSTSTTMRWTSGLFAVIALAIACSTIVLPAFGGETMRPRWPLPIGATRSITRVVRTFGSVSRRRRSCGYSGVSLPKSARWRAGSALSPLTESSRTSALNLAGGLARVGLVALARLPDGAGDGVALAEPGLLDLAHRDVHVAVAGQVAGRPDERVVVLDVEDAGDGEQDVVVADLDLVVAAELPAGLTHTRTGALGAVAIAVPVAVAPAAAATLVVVAVDAGKQLRAVRAGLADGTLTLAAEALGVAALLTLRAAVLRALLADVLATLGHPATLAGRVLAGEVVAAVDVRTVPAGVVGARRAAVATRPARSAVTGERPAGLGGTRGAALVGRQGELDVDAGKPLVVDVATAASGGLALALPASGGPGHAEVADGRRGGGVGAGLAAGLGPRVGVRRRAVLGLGSLGRRCGLRGGTSGTRRAARGTLGRGVVACGSSGAGGVAGALGPDGVHEIALAHPGRPGDAELRGEGLQLGQAQRGDRAAPGAAARSGCLGGSAAHGGVDDVCHEGSFPLVGGRLGVWAGRMSTSGT